MISPLLDWEHNIEWPVARQGTRVSFYYEIEPFAPGSPVQQHEIRLD